MSFVSSVITRWPSIYIELVIRIAYTRKLMRGFPCGTCAFDILARNDNTHALKFTRVYKEMCFGESRSCDITVFVTPLVVREKTSKNEMNRTLQKNKPERFLHFWNPQDL